MMPKRLLTLLLVVLAAASLLGSYCGPRHDLSPRERAQAQSTLEWSAAGSHLAFDLGEIWRHRDVRRVHDVLILGRQSRPIELGLWAYHLARRDPGRVYHLSAQAELVLRNDSVNASEPWRSAHQRLTDPTTSG